MLQVDFARALIREAIASSHRFRLRPSHILGLNRAAIKGLNPFPGVYRPDEMEISYSRHNPPPPDLVPSLMEEMCDYVNDNLEKPPIHIAAYLMWRINWIHPFDDGNGRTSRMASYVLLCIRLGYELPGTNAIFEQIAEQ
ncbi:MAG: Fic family protein [Candidatus Binataceae bacterium]